MSFAQFGSTAVRDAIELLGDVNQDVTVVVGAGSSVESGFPTWDSLVRTLLHDVGDRRGLSIEAQEQFANWTLHREDLTGAGEVAKELLGSDFQASLHEALYSNVDQPLPGETARALSSLRLSRLDALTEILTTNYDTLLYHAMREELKQRGLNQYKVKRVVGSNPVDQNTIAIRHLHGVMTEGRKVEGNLVLSDRDYYLMQDSSAWQESFFKAQLESTTCLFIGASLTDPNLLRYIYRSGGSGLHYVVFVRQTDASDYDSSSEMVRKLKEESQSDKWKAVNVEPILLDHYSQSAQFLWEVFTASRPGAYIALPRRLHDWQNDLANVLPASGPEFRETQAQLQLVMKKALDATKKLLNETGQRLRPGEKLGMSLWVFDPKADSLVNWGSADRVWVEPSTLEPIPVHWSSPFVASQAFCSGSMVSQSTSRHVVSRWNHVIGFPIYLHLENQRLPVGAVTLASTRGPEDSLLKRSESTVRGSVIPALEHQASEILNPWDI